MMRRQMMRILFLFSVLLSTLYSYQPPTAISIDIWNEVTPFLLSESSHEAKALKKLLDTNKRVTRDFASMQKRGFILVAFNDRSHLAIFRHGKLPGFLIKIFLDTSHVPNDWLRFLVRVQGAHFIQSAINRNGYSHLMITPKKWLYPIPDGGLPQPMNFLLIVEEMDLVSRKDNEKRWSSSSLSANTLRAFRTILSEVGLIDSIYVDNVPFLKNGKICFIDTEHFHKWPVPWEKFTKNLSSQNQTLWLQINQ